MGKTFSTSRRLLWATAALTSLCTLGSMCWQYANYRSALSTTLEWARLTPFPVSATDLVVDIRGSIFTREFVMRFNAPMNDINAWLEMSPGTADVQPTKLGFVRTYSIEPGGGAQDAELKVNEQTGTVQIRVYWS